jgi:hypothetical protein
MPDFSECAVHLCFNANSGASINASADMESSVSFCFSAKIHTEIFYGKKI